ncbi:hypothetical protein HDU93_009056 [Gonapodya sp. JEL0774]|nr:hypothetical protein HDU93_009056 [Gonapodya sp. JEL0774]
MDKLPVEILGRIFRLLEPRPFYRTIPLVSSSFRAASLSAIPGCPGDSIGVVCFTSWKAHSRYAVHGGPYFRKRINSEYRICMRASGTPVWTAITVWFVVFDDSRTIRILASRFNHSIVIQQVMADVDLRIPFHLAKDFVRANKIAEFNIAPLSEFTQLEQCRDLGDIVMYPVVKLEVLGGPGDNLEHTARRLRRVLTVFPSIVELSCGSLFYLSELASAGLETLIATVPASLRARLRCLKASPIPNESGPGGRLALLRSPIVFSNLMEVGTLYFDDIKLTGPFIPRDSQCTLTGVQKFHINITTASIPDNATCVRMEESAKHLVGLLPSLKHLVVKLFFNSNLDKQEDIERVHQFLDLLLHV